MLLKHLFEQNKAWAKSTLEKDHDFFHRLSKQQTPQYLWIGCSDSRVPVNQIVNLPPGEVFVHRNIANVVVHTDLNCLSVIQYAIEVLKIKDVIVCGHYGCGGVKAALENKRNGLIDNWLCNVKDVLRIHLEKFKNLNEKESVSLLCKLNVLEQVKNVCRSTIVQNSWGSGEQVAVHGLIYDINNGILKNLECSISSIADLKNHS